MKNLRTTLLMIGFIAFAGSCTKAPTTCVNADATDVAVGVDVTVTSCTEKANGYIWGIPGNTTIVSGGGACNDNVVLTFNSPGSYTLYLTGINYLGNRGCNGTGVRTVSGNREPIVFNVN